MPPGVGGQAILHGLIRHNSDGVSLSDPQKAARQVFERRGVGAETLQAPLYALDLAEGLPPMLPKAHRELWIAGQPVRETIQSVHTGPLHRMRIAQPGNQRLFVLGHGITPSVIAAAPRGVPARRLLR